MTDMLKQIYTLTARVAMIVCLLCLSAACADEHEKGRVQNSQEDDERLVTLTFKAMVPGMAEATRVAGDGSVDEYITRLELYLFDHKNGFSGVVTPTVLTHNSQHTGTVTDGNGKFTSSSEYNANIGTYTVTIPQNTKHIHFLANYDREAEGFDVEEHIGRTEMEVFGPLSTQKRIYWGRSTATYNASTGQMTIDANPVVLYRNYAKVKVVNASSGKLNIYGWTLYRQPTHGTVAPYDAAKVPTYESPDLSPFVFDNLSSLKMTAPIYAYRTTQGNTAQNQTDALENINKYTANAAHWMFEYDDELYRSVAEGESNRVFAIFKIGQIPTGQTEEDIRFYKIELLKTTGTGTSAVKTPYDVVRNWEYVINFKGVTPDFGEPVTEGNEAEALKKVIERLPANNDEVSISKVLPEVVSSQYTMRIEDEGKGSTIRYYKTDEVAAFASAGTNSNSESLYTINDITVFYNGASNDASKLTAVWEEGEALEGAKEAITVTPSGNNDNKFTLSFKTTNFTDSPTTTPHYKWGRIRVSESVEGLLSRYVKVYIGPAITFRPLLYSSDIPNLVDERLTVLFTIPDEQHLPADLYPIEVRFGSDRVDVERNNEVASMKVDVAGSADDVAALDYENVLRWRAQSNGTYAWTAHQDYKVINSWGYEYVYAIESPAQRGQKRITLRTVSQNNNDFRVMMEGRSTVTGTPIFNTRELYFMMQNDGTTSFDNGEWTTTTVGSNNQYKRIMLKNGMPETRYVTAYVNAMRQTGTDASAGMDVNIEYDLGTFDNGTKTATAPSETVNIWAYYDAEKLTPKSVTAGGITNSTFTEGTNLHTDTEGNTFIRFQHGTGSSSGTVTFTTKSGANVENSVVFLTARYWKKYGWAHNDDSEYPDNVQDFVKQNNLHGSTHCGVNYLAESYRSAGAIINIRNSWDFNPAPSLTNETGSYSFDTDITIDYGAEKNLYLRIDRPANTDDVKLSIDTQGKFKLVENADEYTIDSTDDTNGKYTITLENKNSEYCYLSLQSLKFDSGCTISLTSATGSAVPYNPATLEVTNNPINFEYFRFANENDLAETTISYYEADADDNVHRTALPIKGAQIGVRVYFPTTMATQGDFRFRLSSNCFKVVDNGKTVTVNGTSTDTYSVEDYSVAGDGLIVATKGSVLQTETITKKGETTPVTLCYLDILLESTCIASTESVKFLGAGQAGDFHFYPYTVGLLHDGSKEYTVSVMHQKDGMTEFTSNPLADVGPAEGKSIIIYQIVLPNLGRAYTLPMTVTHGGYFKDVNSDKYKVVEDEKEYMYKYVSHDDNSYQLTVDTKAGETRTISFSFDMDTEIPQGTTVPITFDIGGDVVKLTPNPTSLGLADLLPIEAALSISTDGSSYTTLADGSTYHQMPASKENTVYLKLTLPASFGGEDLNVKFESETKIHYRNLRLNGDNETYAKKGDGYRNIFDYTYSVPNSESDDYTYTTNSNGEYEVVLKMKTRSNGIAEKLTISGTSNSYELNAKTVIVATPPTTIRNKYAVSFSSNNAKLKDGNEVFSISAANPQTSAGDLSSFANCGTHGVKMDGDGFITFYAPDDNMYLTIISAITDGKNKTTGKLVVKNANNKDVYTTGDAEINGSRFVYQLESKGLYSIRRASGNTMGVFYLELNKSNPDEFGTIGWTAVDTNSDNKGGVTKGTITNNKISVSDFYEKLTLTIPLETTATLNLSSENQYKFEDGSYTQSVTPTDGSASVTLVPVTTSNGELVDGTFTLSGSDANGCVFNAQTIEVYVRPYVIASGLNINYDGYLYGYVQVGKTFNVTVTIPNDVNTIGKEVAFSFPWANGFSGVGYISQESVPAEYVDGKIAKENVIADKVYTFTWIVDVAGADKQMILQARNSGETDIVRADIKNIIYNNQNFWPYLHTIDDTYVMIGVGEYSASVKYWDVKVTNLDGTKTYLDGNGSWTSSDASQPWTVSNGTVSNTFDGTNGTHYARRDFAYPNTGYKFTCKAMKTDYTGVEGFLIIFDHAPLGTNRLHWNIGGWTNSCHTIEGFGKKSNVEKAYPQTSGDKLVTVNVTYNIEITVENGIATCTCTPNTVGEYYMEYVFNMTTGTCISNKTVRMNTTYEYYITDTNIKETERYKHVRINGVAQTSEIDVIKMNGAWAYQNNGGPVTITPYDGNNVTLENGEHINQDNQYITLSIPYPMTIHYKWVPRYASTSLDIYDSTGSTIIATTHTNKDGNPTSNFEVNKWYEVNQSLQPGEYRLKSTDETVLWYLKLSPYTP